MNRGKGTAVASILLPFALALLFTLGCGGGNSASGERESAGIAETARAGEALFNANCAACHGAGAAGTDLGPPLVHRIYHPGHHSDLSIHRAVSRGVVQHHWFFGDMPPVAGLATDDVDRIACYIRQQQRAAGIFEGDGFGAKC